MAYAVPMPIDPKLKSGSDPQGAGLELGRARAERAMARHILHLAMPALRQPLQQPRLGGRHVGFGDADGLEAQFGAPGLDALCECCVIHAGPS